MSRTDRSVMVTVHRLNGSFFAYAEMEEAVHPTSATIAAQMAAAEHFCLAREAIAVEPVSEGVMRATVKPDAPARPLPGWVKGLGAVIAAYFVGRTLWWAWVLFREMTGGGL